MDEDKKEEKEANGDSFAADDKVPDLGNGTADELEKIKKERGEYLDGWQRARAELINYKKDEAKRMENIAKFSNEQLVRELILILDTFDLALSALEKDGKADKGVYLIKAQFEDVLKNYGLEKVKISVGDIFDPSLSEAVAMVESDKLSQTIVEIVDDGYYLNGKLVRPARVKVAK